MNGACVVFCIQSSSSGKSRQDMRFLSHAAFPPAYHAVQTPIPLSHCMRHDPANIEKPPTNNSKCFGSFRGLLGKEEA